MKTLAWLPQDGTTDSLCDSPVLWDSAENSQVRYFQAFFGLHLPCGAVMNHSSPCTSHIPGMLCQLRQPQLGRITAQLGKFGGTAHMLKTERFLLQIHHKYSWKQLHPYQKAPSFLKASVHGSSLCHPFISIIRKTTKTDAQLICNAPFLIEVVWSTVLALTHTCCKTSLYWPLAHEFQIRMKAACLSFSSIPPTCKLPIE